MALKLELTDIRAPPQVYSWVHDSSLLLVGNQIIVGAHTG